MGACVFSEGRTGCRELFAGNLHSLPVRACHARHEMEVWQEIAENAERGAERLVAEYGDRLYAAATLLCRNREDAEELVFKTLAQAVRKIRQFKPSGSFFGWLYAILLNYHRMELRKNWPDLVFVGSTQDLPQVPAADNHEAAEEIRELVHLLPSHFREVVVLKYFSGMSIEEIAGTLGVPQGTVKSRLFIAKRILADGLGLARRKGTRK